MDGVYLHLHSIGLYKTIRVDVCLSTPLCVPRNSLVALSSRLLRATSEFRGTHSGVLRHTSTRIVLYSPMLCRCK